MQQYRYPVVANSSQPGPEQVFRFVLGRTVANFGVAVLRGDVQPRVVQAGDENRLVGIPGLPFNINPYVDEYGDARPIAGAIRPAPGATTSCSTRGPQGRPGSRSASGSTTCARRPRACSARRRAPGSCAFASPTPASGVDPLSLDATVDGDTQRVRLASGVASVDVDGVAPRGTHRLVFTVSDYQEAKNMENVTRILPNTRVLRATIRVP